MKKVVYLLTLIFLSASMQSLAQKLIAPNHYCINFTNKKDSPYSIDKPDEFLSEKAIERRKKFNIKITQTDIPVNSIYVDSLKSLGFKVLYTSKWMNHAIVYAKDSTLIEKLADISFIKPYKENKKYKKAKHVEKTVKPKFKKDKNLKNDTLFNYGRGTNQIVMLNGHLMHNKGFRGENVTIAVLDAGFYKVDKLPAFDSLWTNNQILGWYDFVDGDTTVFDSDTHGMHALSCIAANIPGEFIGTAPKANFWLFRTEQGRTEYQIEEYNWIAAAEKADSAGVDIIHTSLGYNDFDQDMNSYTYEDMDGNTAPISNGADMAVSKGIMVVTSAGNEGNDPWKYISAPADADSVLSVGAVDNRGKYVYFSSQGPTHDGRVKPNVTAKGLWTTVQGSSGNVSVSSGTSFSAPVIAGMVACLMQAHPNATVMEVVRAIEQSSSHYSKPDEKYGYGIPDFYLAHLILSGVSINDLNKDNPFIIYPNPFRTGFNIGIFKTDKDKISNYSIAIYNLYGQKVHSFNVKLEDIVHSSNNLYFTQLPDIENGIYVVKLTNNNNIYNQKIIKL